MKVISKTQTQQKSDWLLQALIYDGGESVRNTSLKISRLQRQGKEYFYQSFDMHYIKT